MFRGLKYFSEGEKKDFGTSRGQRGRKKKKNKWDRKHSFVEHYLHLDMRVNTQRTGLKGRRGGRRRRKILFFFGVPFWALVVVSKNLTVSSWMESTAA